MSENRNKMSRHEQRVAVFTLVFETPFRSDESPADIYLSESADRELAAYDYIKNTYLGIEDSLGEIDPIIKEYAVGWKMERISNTARAVLRVSVYELLHTDVPPKVVINEAVEISKEYASEEEASFVNGILNKLAHDKGIISSEPKEDVE